MKYLTILLAFVLLISLATAQQQTLGTFKQGESINLLQTCADCTYVNISYVQAPNSTVILSNKVMTKSGVTFNHTLEAQQQLGNYIVCGVGDLEGTATTWCYDFEITILGDKFDNSQSPIIYIAVGLTTIFALFFFALGVMYPYPASRIIFFSLAGIMLVVGILYALVIAEQIIPQQLIIIDGLATLWSVIKILVGIFLILLVLFALYMSYWSWLTKRGLRD